PAKPAEPPLPPLPPGQENRLAGNEKPAAKTPPAGTDDGLPPIPAAAPPAAPPAAADPLPPVSGPNFWSSLWGTTRETTVAVKNALKKDADRTGENKPVAKA